MSNKNYTVVCDGGKKNGLVYGSFKLYNPSGKEIAHHFMFFGFGTSNTAEYLALINSAKYCNKNGIRHVTFKSDSLIIINQIKGIWIAREHLRKLRGVARNELNQMKSWKLVKLTGKEVKKILGH